MRLNAALDGRSDGDINIVKTYDYYPNQNKERVQEIRQQINVEKPNTSFDNQINNFDRNIDRNIQQTNLRKQGYTQNKRYYN